ncbi:MAG: cytoplasmic protein [Litorimonas sp.]
MSVWDLSEDHVLRVAHRHSSNHKTEELDSFQCGCFHCLNLFKPTKIKEWVDDGTTAICPKCGIDSVIGDAEPFDLNESFLRAMNGVWF